VLETRPGRQATIVGIGQTEFVKQSEKSELALACEAVLDACQDAGLAVADIDGITRYDVEQNTEWDVIYALGIPTLRFFAGTPSGGGGVANTIILAAMAVETGMATTVVTYRARKRGRRSAYGPGQHQGGRPWAKVGTSVAGPAQFHHPFGLASPAQEMALIARRHMHEYGTTAEQFGLQAVAQRRHASRNPRAIMRDPISIDDWAASRMIADPLRLFDCSLECDGAVAAIVTTPSWPSTSPRRGTSGVGTPVAGPSLDASSARPGSIPRTWTWPRSSTTSPWPSRSRWSSTASVPRATGGPSSRPGRPRGPMAGCR
jgi:acetyl-CoA acetyltransferase